MAAGAFTLTNTARTSLVDGTFDLDTDTFYVSLYNSSATPSTMTTYSTTYELSTANGYTQGGYNVGALSLSGTTTLTVDETTNPTWTASGGSITARWAVVHNGTTVLGYCVLDSTPDDVTVTDGNTLTIAWHSSGLFTLA